MVKELALWLDRLFWALFGMGIYEEQILIAAIGVWLVRGILLVLCVLEGD